MEVVTQIVCVPTRSDIPTGKAPEDKQRRQMLVRMIPALDDEKVYEFLGKYRSYDDLRGYL